MSVLRGISATSFEDWLTIFKLCALMAIAYGFGLHWGRDVENPTYVRWGGYYILVLVLLIGALAIRSYPDAD
jgi:hypothetical protein